MEVNSGFLFQLLRKLHKHALDLFITHRIKHGVKKERNVDFPCLVSYTTRKRQIIKYRVSAKML